MRVALVHDYLNQFGGGERVLLTLMKMFPEAPVYTILYDKDKTHGEFGSRVASTSFLDFPFARRHHRLFIPLMPAAARSINLGGEYDLIISDSHGFSKGISYDRSKTRHISYIHTPLRYAWETRQYFSATVAGRLFATIFTPAFWYVRRFDYKAAQKPDVLIANSKYIAGKIKQYYGRDAQVIYPPISDFWFSTITHNLSPKTYYLALGRLLEYKRFDLIIKAFNQLKLPLKIVGEGRMKSKLQKLSGPTIEFLPFQTDEKLRELYAGAKAFVMANQEDFGMVMAESLACGTPVIAYGKGGATEIVEDGKNGILFSDQTVESLIQAVKKFSASGGQTSAFDPAEVRRSAEKFSEENFRSVILNEVKNLME